MQLGFIGLGLMGDPMATSLRRHGIPLTVWNRSQPALDRLAAAGATVAGTAYEVVGSCDATIVMLADAAAVTTVLDPTGPAFRDAVRGRGIIHMGTTAPTFSAWLDEHVRAAGGWYVEAPVSGSRVPAAAGQLVAMVAGEPTLLDGLAGPLDAMCAQVLRCGRPPNAMRMKLAVNVLLIGMVTALAEAWHFADSHDLDLSTFAHAVRSGQLAAPVVGVKLDKLLTDDLAPQAALADVLRNADLISAAARESVIPVPVLETCRALLSAAVGAEWGHLDMVGVVRAYAGQSPIANDPADSNHAPLVPSHPLGERRD